ncbi:MAG: sugar phosphate nucleotidyltransferase [Candidatus Saccharimonas aalborgensis]
MITIIIAGGSGTRLWPLSTSDKPKQFLSIDATGKSLLRKTYERVREFSQATYVVTSAPIAEETKRQLPEIAENIVVEPARKGVANALYLGIRRLLRDGYSDDEPVFILWSDHLIRDTETFERTVKEAEAAVQGGAKLVQFGIIPTYPSNQLGYIKKGGNQHGSNVYAIESWKYQPDQETANTWFESGQYLWNAGYFVSTVQYIMGEIKRESPESYAEYQAIVEADEGEIEEVYTHQEGAILDHVLSEKMKGAHVVACTFDWIDIGNYQDLYAVSAHDADENTIRGMARVFNVNNSYIANMTSIPVAVIGLHNVAVVVTDEGIVVVDKSQSRSVGDVAKQIQTS